MICRGPCHVGSGVPYVWSARLAYSRRWSRRYRVIRNSRRTRSRPACPISPRRVGSFGRSHATEVREKVDIGIVARIPCRPLEPQPAFGVVLGHGADHEELNPRDGLLHEAVRIDHAERVLPGIEPAYLTDHRPGRVELEPGEDGLPLTLSDVSILRTHRIDRGRGDDQLAELDLRRRIGRATEDRRAVFLQVWLSWSQPR